MILIKKKSKPLRFKAPQVMIHTATVTLTLSEWHMLSNSIPEGKIFQQQQQKKDIKIIF